MDNLLSTNFLQYICHALRTMILTDWLFFNIPNRCHPFDNQAQSSTTDSWACHLETRGMPGDWDTEGLLKPAESVRQSPAVLLENSWILVKRIIATYVSPFLAEYLVHKTVSFFPLAKCRIASAFTGSVLFFIFINFKRPACTAENCREFKLWHRPLQVLHHAAKGSIYRVSQLLR